MNRSNAKLPPNRIFGFFFCLVFLILTTYFYFLNEILFSLIAFFLTFFFLISSTLKPKILLPLNKLWTLLGLSIGRIINPITLGLIFFGLFSPLSIGMKMFGRDALYLKQKKYQSFWQNGKLKTSKVVNFKLQY